GPALPRRDRPELRSRYCRLMLMLFKPWQHAHDLRAEGQSWEDAFEEFSTLCDPSVVAVLNNMQIMHECRDSRDE
ncbi:hypothetical protein BV25DRAFT_1779794, partial [Artomyces pyxidatus]